MTASDRHDVTVYFDTPPSQACIDSLESLGLVFKRHNGELLHSLHIYLASIALEDISLLYHIQIPIQIESTIHPSMTSTLDVSNPQVEASTVWKARDSKGSPLDGSGILIANVDTGIDIYHPAFFKPDGGTFNWLDTDNSGTFDSNIDHVDLDDDGIGDPDELLSFFDASFSDPLKLIDRTDGVYDADIDWLYNDRNKNGFRDYGIDGGYNENSPSFGEMFFVIDDYNANNRLDPGETLNALGTTKIRAIIDEKGEHTRGIDLFNSVGDSENHGTGSTGILGGSTPKRRFTGMAPGAEYIIVDRTDYSVEEGVLLAKKLSPQIFQYEFGSWVYEFLDGTSNIETLISDLYDEGFHQFTASGNLAGPARKKHAFISLAKNENQKLTFAVPNIGIRTIYMSILWTGKALAPSLQLVFPDNKTFLITGDTIEKYYGAYSFNSGITSSRKNTYRMDVIISSSVSIAGNFSVNITNRRSSSLSVHSYIADDQTQWMNGVQFQNFVTDDGTVCSPGTAEKDITVGAYDPRGTRNTKGNINDFSSWGMTIDGRRAVDITAPGTLVYSFISHTAIGGQPGGYIDFGGTSAALPHVAGCAALALQAHPGMSPSELSQLLFDGCLVDSFTGSTPNTIWGYGKIRIFESLRDTGINLRVKEQLPSEFTVSELYPNPFNSTISFSISQSIDSFSKNSIYVSIYTITGQKIHTLILPLNYTGISTRFTFDIHTMLKQDISSGLLLFSFHSNRTIITKKVLYIK